MPLLLAGLSVIGLAAEKINTPEQSMPHLDGILKQAVAQSPTMISRAIDLELAEQDRITARAGLLPSFVGGASYYKARDEREDLKQLGMGPLNVTKIYYNFAISQPLYHWGDRMNYARMGEIRQSITQGNFQEAYRKLAQEVRNQYFRLILDKVRLERSRFYADFAANQLKQGEVRLQKKVVSEAQMFTIRMEAERSQIAAERGAFDFENDKTTFSRLTGLPPLRDDEIPNTIPPVTVQDQAIQQSLSEFLAQKDLPSAEADSYRKLMKIEDVTLAITKTRLRPKFGVSIGISQDEQSYTLNTAQKYAVQSLFGGVSMSWSIFDGFSANAALRTQLAKIRQMRNEYRGLTERLAQQAQSQARLIGFAGRMLSITERYLVSGEGNLQSKKAEFSRGVISEDDLSGAQIGLYDSQIAALGARADYYNQVCEFLGTVVEDPVLRNLGNK